jgi:O-antigen/teichoic acid export membrane protein
MDILFLKALGGSDVETGYYGAAQNVTILLSMVSVSMSPPLLSTISNMLKNERADEARHISLAVIRASIMFFPVVAMIVGASNEIVILIFGSAYSAAGPILSCLVFAALGLHILNTSITLLSSIERQGLALRISFPLVPIATIGHLFMIPKMGGLGAAMVSTTVAWISASVSTVAALSLWGIKFPFKTLATSLFTAVIFYFAASLWSVSGLMLLIKMAVLIPSIVLCFYFLGEITPRETAVVRRMIMDRLGFRE